MAGLAFAAFSVSGARLQAPDFSLFGQRDLAVQAHVVSAVLALGLGPIVLWRRKGDALHRLLGRLWAAAMVVVCASSFFIESFAPLLGQFGAIHLLSIYTSVYLPRAVWLARQGRIEEHQAIMKGLYAGLISAGLFTLIPGRLIFETFFV